MGEIWKNIQIKGQKRVATTIITVAVTASLLIIFNNYQPWKQQPTPETNQEMQAFPPIKMVKGGPPSGPLKDQKFSEVIKSLTEEQRQCLRNAYGEELYQRALEDNPDQKDSYVTYKEALRIEEGNKCLRTK